MYWVNVETGFLCIIYRSYYTLLDWKITALLLFYYYSYFCYWPPAKRQKWFRRVKGEGSNEHRLKAPGSLQSILEDRSIWKALVASLTRNLDGEAGQMKRSYCYIIFFPLPRFELMSCARSPSLLTAALRRPSYRHIKRIHYTIKACYSAYCTYVINDFHASLQFTVGKQCNIYT